MATARREASASDHELPPSSIGSPRGDRGAQLVTLSEASGVSLEVMMCRPSHLVVGALALMASACNDTTNNVVTRSATIRLVNDTDTPLSLASTGILDSANTRLVFGQASACRFVDLSDANVPRLTITNAVTGASITFAPILTVGANVTVVAFGDTVGNVRFATLSNRFVPATNDAGLRFFNGVQGAGALVMRRGGVVLTPSTVFGEASDFVSVPIDSASITFSNATSFVLDAGQMAFPLGENSTVLIGPPAAGTNPFRFFTVQGC